MSLMTTTKVTVPNDSESFSLLSVRLGLTHILEAEVRHELEQSGDLLRLPGQERSPVCSRRKFIDALNTVVTRAGCSGQLQDNRRLREDKAKQQMHIERVIAQNLRKLK